MGATPLYLAIILERANAYLRASVTLCLSHTVGVSSSFALFPVIQVVAMLQDTQIFFEIYQYTFVPHYHLVNSDSVVAQSYSKF